MVSETKWGIKVQINKETGEYSFKGITVTSEEMQQLTDAHKRLQQYEPIMKGGEHIGKDESI